MSYSLHPQAEQDVADALDFYAAYAGALVVERFLAESERVAHLISEFPDLGTRASKGRRAFPLQIFPYLVIYSSVEIGLRILIVRHQRRKPTFGSGRR